MASIVIKLCLIYVALIATTRSQSNDPDTLFHCDTQHCSRSVSSPDDNKFSLDNLALVFNQLLQKSKGITVNAPLLKNPFLIKPICDRRAEFRTIDGTCNNFINPRNGAAKTPLTRLARNRYEDGENSVRSTLFKSGGALPTARLVSRTVIDQTSNLSSEHSHLMMAYGSFLDHDMSLSPETGGPEASVIGAECCNRRPSEFVGRLSECFPLDVSNDPVFRTRSCIPFLRSSPVPPISTLRHFERFQLNDLTTFLDASHIYGSTEKVAKFIREYRDGLLRVSRGTNGEEKLPIDPASPASCRTPAKTGCRFLAGEVRNSEEAGLSVLHILMLREHNRIATEIKRLNPQWKDPVTRDEKIYQNTRKIVGAILQRVSYREWIPEVLGPEVVRQQKIGLRDSGRTNGYKANIDASIITEFSTAAYRFGHTIIRQQFTVAAQRQVDIQQMFDAFNTVDTYGTSGILNGFAKDASQSYDRFIVKGIQDELFGMDLDLIALNVQRGRDHGIGSYMDLRRFFKLRTFTKYDDMIGVTHNLDSINKLKMVYPNPEDIELFPGGISELSVNDGLVGPVFANIMGLQFKKLKFGDRFWHETNDRRIRFTDAQLKEIRKSSLAQLYCDNLTVTHVREYLLLQQSTSNPAIPCSQVPRLDLSAWARID